MDELALISFVQQYEELYNLRHPHYMNQQRRDNIWEEIGEQMNETGAACRERWTRIRENYRKALSLRKTKSGQAATKIKPPKYNKELSFLFPYINDEEHRVSNISVPARETPSSVNSPHSESGEDFQQAESPLPRYTPTRSCSRTSSHRSTENPTTSVATVLTDYLAKQNRSRESAQNNINVNQDPIIDFFMSMARTVQRLDKKKQLYIKGQLFQLVHNAEMETLNEKEATSESIDTVHSPEMTLFTLPPNSLQNTTVSHLTNAESVRPRIAPTTPTVTSGVSHLTNAESVRPRNAPTTSTVTSGVSHFETVRPRIAPTTSTGTIPQQEMASIHPTHQITIMSDEIINAPTTSTATIPQQVMIMSDEIINASYDHESSEVDEELKKYVVFKKY